jgi:uncharacterized membrane protein
MRAVALVFLLLTGTPLWAQDYPAFHSVTKVDADDVLNIRAMPEAGAAIIGTLAPDATEVEVIGVADGWAMLNAGDAIGYADLRFLARAEGPAWNSLKVPLRCLGTEPFWSLKIDPAAGTASFSSPDEIEGQISDLAQTWPGELWAPAAALSLPEGLAVLYPAECSDGMSERGYGITIDIFLTGTDRSRLSGCCLLDHP